MECKDDTGREIAENIAHGIAKGIAIGIALAIAFVLFIFLGGFVVQWLWNWLAPDLFALRRITFWEALGLLALCRILFGGFGLGATVIFAVAVFESFVYLIGHGALDWGPAKADQPREVVSPARTSTSTIRRVGLEGRTPEATPEPSRAA